MMPTEHYFDLESAKKALDWLIPKVTRLRELSKKGDLAMEEYNLDLADVHTRKIHRILDEIHKKGILIRDREATLFDFPAVIDNIPAYLCWSIGEDNIEFWHFADQGFSGRQRITGTEHILSYL